MPALVLPIVTFVIECNGSNAVAEYWTIQDRSLYAMHVRNNTWITKERWKAHKARRHRLALGEVQ